MAAGLVVSACALVLAWERRRRVPVGWRDWLCVAATPLGLLLVIAYQSVVVGDGFAWVHAQRAWNRHLVFPWQTLYNDWRGFPAVGGRDVEAMYRVQEALALTVVLPFFFVRQGLGIPWAIWFLGLAEWLIPLCSHSLISASRFQAGNVYLALAIPAFLVSRPLLRALAWLLFGMVLAFYATMYPVGNWTS